MLLLLGLYLTSLHSYLLFHSLAEIFSIAVAFCIFMLAWSARRFLVDTYFLFIGIAYLFIGGLDLIHTLSYSGMGVFPESNTNLPTQLWIGARYMEGLSFMVAPFFINRRWKTGFVFFGYGLATFLLVASIFYWPGFPTCFIEGMGLTPFKKVSEYIICLLLLGATAVMYKRRNEFDRGVLRLLVASIVLTVASELAFTFYVHAYGLSNLIGHYFKIGSFYLIYKAVIDTGLAKPYDLLFRDLKKNEEELKWELTLNAALAELYEPLVSPSSAIEEIAHIVLEKAKDLTGSEHGYVSSIDPRSGDNVSHTLTEMLKDRCGISEEQRKIVFPRDADGLYPTLWGHALNTKEAFFTNSPRAHQASTGLPDGHVPITRLLSVPVLLGNEVVGQIALANKPIEYDEKDLQAVGRVASHYALAIQRIRAEQEIRESRDELEIRVRERTAELAQVVEELRREIEERKRVERALKESERKYSTLVEESLTGVYIEQDGKIEFANERFAAIYGYPREEIIGIENWSLVHPEDRGMVREIRERRLRGKEAPLEYEARGLTRDGKPIWVVRRNKLIQYRDRPAILGNVVDVTGRKEIEGALQKSERELRFLSSQLLSAEERERKRIARELHDGIGQLLGAVKFSLENTLNEIQGKKGKWALESLKGPILLIQKAIEEVRRIVMDLRPSTLDDLGIVPTINWFCREFQNIYSGIAVQKEIDVQEKDVPEEVKTAIFRVLQEAFNNLAKHSQSDIVYLSLKKKEGRLALAVRDRGGGFSPEEMVSWERRGGGFGLASMRERTELSGGTFSIESSKGVGTIVHASWPVEEGMNS